MEELLIATDLPTHLSNSLQLGHTLSLAEYPRELICCKGINAHDGPL